MAISNFLADSYSYSATSSTQHIHQLDAELVQVHMVVVVGVC